MSGAKTAVLKGSANMVG